MARMHSRKKGISGSKKPQKLVKPTWLRYKPAEVEMLAVKLAKEGLETSQIGLHLRDSYGIPDIKTITGKTVTKILQEKKITKEIPEDLRALMRKAVAVRKHFSSNKHDYSAKRGQQLTEAKINRLVKYYKRSGRLSQDWKYDPEKASFYIG